MSQPAQRIFFSRKFKAFSVGGVVRRGVHPVIHKVFCPEYSYEKAKLGNFTASRERGSKRETKFRPSTSAGLLVDRELKRSVTLFTVHNLPLVAFKDFETQKTYAEKLRYQLTTKAHSLLKQKLAPAVYKIWQTCIKLKLTPSACQVNVGSTDLRLGSAVDLVCKDAQGRVVIVEIKTGFMKYLFLHTSKPMNVIQPPINDSVFHQHQLQLLLTYQLYRTTFPDAKMGAAFIFRIDALGCDVFPLIAAIRSNACRIFKAVQTSS